MGDFIIKESSKAGEQFDYVAKPNFSALQDELITMAYTTETGQTTLDGVLSGTGWTAQVVGTKKRTTTITEMTRYDSIYKIADNFRYEIEFDIENKVIKMAEKIGVGLGKIYIHDQVNLIQLNTSGDSYDVYTRIIPRGRNGQGIESVNNGLPYLDNFQHTNKIKPYIWEDGRYTNLDQLKADALEILEDISKPRHSYSVDVINLYKKDSAKWAFLKYKTGDYIDLISNKDGVDVKQRIIATETYLESSGERDSIIIQNLNRNVSREAIKENDILRQATENVRASLELLDESIEGKIETFTTHYIENSDIVTNQDLADKIVEELQPFQDAIDEQSLILDDFEAEIENMSIETYSNYIVSIESGYEKIMAQVDVLTDTGGDIDSYAYTTRVRFLSLKNYFDTAVADGVLTESERTTIKNNIWSYRVAFNLLEKAVLDHLSQGIGILSDELTVVRQELTGDSIINEVSKTEVWRDTIATIPDMDNIGDLIDEKIVDYGTLAEQDAEEFRRTIHESITENSELIASRTRYFSETINGLEIGLEGSPFATLINEKKLAFLQSGSAVAYIQHNRMVIEDVVAKKSIQMGEHKFESYAGNLTIARWVGPYVEEN